MKRKVISIALLAFLAMAQIFAISSNQLVVVADDGTFLGTLENEYSQKSVYNEYGDYGSKYSPNSIFNKYGSYGSDYSPYSPFNKYTINAPWLMDRNGNYYGRLSVNKYAQGVTDYSYRLACRLKARRDSM